MTDTATSRAGVPGTASPAPVAVGTGGSDADRSGTASATALPTVPPTARLAWAFALGAALLALLLRVPTLRGYVSGLLVEHPDVVSGLDDPHLQQLAINVGLAMVVVVSLALLVLYQSLGRALERHVFTKSVGVGPARLGLFFTISTAATLPFHAFCAAFGRVTLRTSLWYYVVVLVVSIASVLPFRRHWRGLHRSKVLILFVSSAVYGLLATLI